MREKVEDMAGLAAALREAVAENETWRGSLLSVANAISEPEPAVHWHGPFAHHGGECPVPPETAVEARYEGGGARSGTAAGMKWRRKVTSFSYAADNPEGWVPRPEGWVPPDEAWPLEWKSRAMTSAQRDGQVGNRELLAYEWQGVTHIRLLPRPVATEPTPIPADARAVVREALEAFIAEKSDYMEHNHLGNPARQHTIKQGRAALAALDAAPAEGETLPEWARVDQRGALWITSPSTYDLRVAASDRTPDEMERMATALSRRVARLRREPE